VSRRLSSPRFRRRALSTAGLAAVAAAVTGLALGLRNTPDFPAQHLVDRPAQVAPRPRPERLNHDDAQLVFATSSRFVRTAVVHRRLVEAYDLVGPELRGGLSRSEWARGANPVVPFPAVGIVDWQVAYSYRNDVALDLSLVAKPGSDTIGKTFRIELRRRARTAPWKVVAWMPNGISGAGNVRSIARREAAAPAPPTATLGAWWLLFPVSLISLAFFLPLALWLRGWRAGKRAERAYRAGRGLPS
jgi:hypothetical protein